MLSRTPKGFLCSSHLDFFVFSLSHMRMYIYIYIHSYLLTPFSSSARFLYIRFARCYACFACFVIRTTTSRCDPRIKRCHRFPIRILCIVENFPHSSSYLPLPRFCLSFLRHDLSAFFVHASRAHYPHYSPYCFRGIFYSHDKRSTPSIAETTFTRNRVATYPHRRRVVRELY